MLTDKDAKPDTSPVVEEIRLSRGVRGFGQECTLLAFLVDGEQGPYIHVRVGDASWRFEREQARLLHSLLHELIERCQR